MQQGRRLQAAKHVHGWYRCAPYLAAALQVFLHAVALEGQKRRSYGCSCRPGAVVHVAYASSRSSSRTPNGAGCGLPGNGGWPGGGRSYLSLTTFTMMIWAFVAFPAVALCVKAAGAEGSMTSDTSSDCLLVTARRWRAGRIGCTLLLGLMLRRNIALRAALTLARALSRWRLYHVCERGTRRDTNYNNTAFAYAIGSGRASRGRC